MKRAFKLVFSLLFFYNTDSFSLKEAKRLKKTMLLFDLDGTLWDSAAPVAESWNQVLQREVPSLPPLTVDDIHGVMGMTMKEIGQSLYPDCQIPNRF